MMSEITELPWWWLWPLCPTPPTCNGLSESMRSMEYKVCKNTRYWKRYTSIKTCTGLRVVYEHFSFSLCPPPVHSSLKHRHVFMMTTDRKWPLESRRSPARFHWADYSVPRRETKVFQRAKRTTIAR